MVTRKQHLISRLSNKCNFIYIEPYKAGRKIHFNKKSSNITIFTIPTFKLGSKFLNILFSTFILRIIIFSIQKLYLNLFIKKNIDLQVISNPSFIQLVDNKYPIIWDYNDNPFQFAKPSKWLLELYQNFLYKHTQMIWASSRQLKTKIHKSKYEKNIIYIPNGVDVNHFKNINKEKGNKFIIGYVGIISSWFFDFELIKTISENFPNIIIKLIGPKDPLAIKQIQELYKFENIEVKDKVDYKVLPEIISSFNIGIIPLKQSENVYQLNSAKFLQYLAIGIPIVSVPFIEFKQFQNNTFFCNSNKEFINSIKFIIQNKIKINRNNINIDSFNWDEISQKALSSINSLIGKK